MLYSLREKKEGKLQMLISRRKNCLDSLFKEEVKGLSRPREAPKGYPKNQRDHCNIRTFYSCFELTTPKLHLHLLFLIFFVISFRGAIHFLDVQGRARALSPLTILWALQNASSISLTELSLM